MRNKTALLAAMAVMTLTGVRQDADAAFQAAPLPASTSPIEYVAYSQAVTPDLLFEPDLGAQNLPGEFGYQIFFGPGRFDPFVPEGESPPVAEPKPQSKVAPRIKRTAPKQLVARIRFDAPVLAPLAHTQFCLRYKDECRPHRTVFRGGAMSLTPERLAELHTVNREVNQAISPERNTEGLAAEKWLISPKTGDCNDYAVTKRHELRMRGWPSRALLLAEVVTNSGEHHLILVVRTKQGDFVADNLTSRIRPWSEAPYEWVRIQSPVNPSFWSTVARAMV